MSDAVKAALEAGAQAVCRWPDGLSCNSSQPSPACENCTGHAAAAVAAFLRALPDVTVPAGVEIKPGPLVPQIMAIIAEEVARAAQEGKR